MPETATKVPVSMRAIIQRINRVLAKQEEQLKTARGGRAQFDLGDYYTIDQRHNFIVEKRVDVENLARELEVLAAWEKIA